MYVGLQGIHHEVPIIHVTFSLWLLVKLLVFTSIVIVQTSIRTYVSGDLHNVANTYFSAVLCRNVITLRRSYKIPSKSLLSHTVSWSEQTVQKQADFNSIIMPEA